MAKWLPVHGYEERYLVSNEGEILSLPKSVSNGTRFAQRKAKLLKQGKRGNKGLLYSFVVLSDGKGNTEHKSVHRIVAEAFLPNPQNLPEVNHKDENPLNNNADNLEWCTRQYNIEYSKNKPIAQYEDGVLTAEYDSATIASAITGIGRRAINNALCGRSRSAGGYGWKYILETEC